jgi:hypothetical protein
VPLRERRGGACLELVEYVSKKLWRPVSDRRSLAANSVKGAWLARSFTLSTNNYLGSWIPGLKAWPLLRIRCSLIRFFWSPDSEIK